MFPRFPLGCSLLIDGPIASVLLLGALVLFSHEATILGPLLWIEHRLDLAPVVV